MSGMPYAKKEKNEYQYPILFIINKTILYKTL
jgi:hypothetical protein